MNVFETARNAATLGGLDRSFSNIVTLMANQTMNANREIESTEDIATSEALNRTARLLHSYVLSTPRSLIGISWLQLRVERMFQIDPAGALGLHLAAHLVICGVHLDYLKGPEWVTGSGRVVGLQTLLQGFMQRRGVDAWPVAYADVREFSKLARQHQG